MLRRLTVTLLSAAPFVVSQSATPTTTWPIENNGITQLVEWDHYSLIYNNERAFDFGGEFHPFRIPVPEMWQDIIEKVKAIGMNSVSYYSHWGYHSSDPSTLDFTTGGHDIVRLYKYAKEAGIFVQCRPGPYINGETTAGGLPLWVVTGEYGSGSLRNNATAWTDAWVPYIEKMANITREWQVTTNGTAFLWQIENELGNQWTNVAAKTPNPSAIAYFEKLEQTARDGGIEVPFIANMPSMSGKSWSTDYDTVGAGGDVNIYGLDSYVWRCLSL